MRMVGDPNGDFQCLLVVVARFRGGETTTWESADVLLTDKSPKDLDKKGNKVSWFMSQKGGSGTKSDIFTRAEAAERQGTVTMMGALPNPG